MSKEHILYEMNPRIQDQFSAGLNKWFILIIVNVTVSAVKSLYMNGRIEWIAYKWLFLLKYKWDIKYSSGNWNKTRPFVYSHTLKQMFYVPLFVIESDW